MKTPELTLMYPGIRALSGFPATHGFGLDAIPHNVFDAFAAQFRLRDRPRPRCRVHFATRRMSNAYLSHRFGLPFHCHCLTTRANANSVDARAEQARPMTPTELRSAVPATNPGNGKRLRLFRYQGAALHVSPAQRDYADGVWFLPGDGKLVTARPGTKRPAPTGIF